jgi:hypothetical protein
MKMNVEDFDVDLDALRSKRRKEARFAQRFLYHMGPRDAPRLPLSDIQYQELMWCGGGIKQITALYARSLALFEYKVFDHPDFERFASGVMASPFAPRHILNDPALQRRFPPRALAGLGPGLIWSPTAAAAQGESICRWPSPNSRSGPPPAPPSIDLWRPRLNRVLSDITLAGQQYISIRMLMDILGLPKRGNTAAFWHLSELLAEFGWTKACERDFSRPGYVTIVRGYVRQDG